MKVPANVSADKLILDYLSRVTEAGLRYLPKGARIAFVGRTRALIERECGPDGLTDPTRVAEVLAGLGEPLELVRQERARIDAEWVRRRAGGKQAGQAAAAGVTKPIEHRPLTARWKPATDSQLLPHRASPPGPAGGEAPAPAGGEGPGPAGGEGSAPAGGEGPGPAGRPAPGQGAAAGGGSEDPGGAPPSPPVPRTAPEEESGHSAPAGAYPDRPVSYPVPPRGRPGRPGGPSAPSQPSAPEGGRPQVGPALRRLVPQLSADQVAALASAGARAARRQPVESLAIVLMGLGVILPFPFWLLGGVVVVMSRLFDARDKWAAAAGPPLLALAGTVLTAAVVGGPGNPVAVYLHALPLDTGILLRVGSLACVGYLVRRLRQGPRLRVPPWRR